MELINLKCPNCGASLNAFYSLHRASCDFCKSNFLMEDGGNPITSSAPSQDNPIGVKYVMRLVSELVIQLTESSSNYGTRPVAMKEGMLDASLKFIAGCAYLLGQTYPVIVESGFVLSDYVYEGKERLSRKQKRLFQDFNQSKEALAKEYENSFRALVQKYGVTPREDKQPGTDYLAKQGLCDWMFFPCVKHHIYGKVSVSPSYLEAYFPALKENIDRIKGYKEISLMAENCLSYMYPDSDASLLANPSFIFFNGDLSKHGHFPCIGQIKYSEFGMEDISNPEMVWAVQVSVIYQIIELAKENHLALWDLAYGLEMDVNDTSSTSSYYILETILRNRKEMVKTYKEW